MSLEWQTIAGWHVTRLPVERCHLQVDYSVNDMFEVRVRLTLNLTLTLERCHLRRAQVVTERHAAQFGGGEDAR